MANAESNPNESGRIKAFAVAFITVGLIAASMWLFQIAKSPYELAANSSLSEIALGQDARDEGAAPRFFTFEIDNEPPSAIAVLVLSDIPIGAVNVNSSQLRSLSDSQSLALLPHGTLRGAVFEIPRNYLLPGRNLVDVLPSGDGLAPEVISARILESDDAFKGLQQLRYWGEVIPALLLGIGGLAGAACLGGLLMGMRKGDYIPLLFLAAILACAGAMSYDVESLEISGLAGPIGVALLIGYGLSIGAIAFDLRAYEEPLNVAESAALVAMVVWLVISLIGFVAGLYAISPIYVFCIGAIGATIYVCLRLLRIFCLDLLAFRSKLQFLESMIDRQAGQLDEKSQLVAREMQRSAVLEERQRMMRDIHDGIGGQLLSLMLRVRSGNLNPDETARGIKQSLSDLRLVVDSADHLGGDLMSALATFRSRAQQQLAAAGIKLEWKFDDDLSGRFQSTSKTLDLYRFMQEAVTNIARHSNASAAQVQIEYEEAQARLLVEIHDDGCGLPNDLEARAGKGLANLAERARRLEAEHSLESAENGSGTIVRLSLDPR